MHCWFNVMAFKPWITAEFVTICCSMSVVMKLCADISMVKEATKATHTWTKLHTEVLSWISSLCDDYAWTFPEANSTTVCDLYHLWAARPCLSWSAVALCVFNMSCLHSGLLYADAALAFSRSVSLWLDSEGSIVLEHKFWQALACMQIWNVCVPSYNCSI